MGTAIVAPRVSGETFALKQSQIFLILYDALLPSCVLSILHAWIVQETSPTFATAFGPLGIVFTALGAWVFNGEVPTAGIYFSVPVIVVGVLLLILGKQREKKCEPARAGA